METQDWKSVSLKCNQQEKPLILYINSREEISVDADLVLTNDVFHNFTQDKFNILGISIEQPEGKKVSNLQKFEKPPIFAIIVFPSPNNP